MRTPTSSHRITLRIVAAVVATVVLACSSGEAREPAPVDAALPRTVVDSIFPVEEALRRFRVGIPEVAAFEGGAPTRDSLVAGFIAAVEALDTAAIRRKVLSRAEFAWLYYPTSTFAREPYYQMPNLTWFLNVEDSQKGITRVFARFGGMDLQYAGYACAPTARRDGGLSFWDRCLVDIEHEGRRRRLRLFGSIVELNGRFKFYSYANDL